MNVHPADVEAALLKQAGMRAAVVSGGDFAGGMVPVAAVLFGGSTAELDEAVARANQEQRVSAAVAAQDVCRCASGRLSR